jgi:hypothetical protein
LTSHFVITGLPIPCLLTETPITTVFFKKMTFS